jgi:hypothetical protein
MPSQKRWASAVEGLHPDLWMIGGMAFGASPVIH